MGTLNFDRYHAAMGDASYKDVTNVHGKPLSDLRWIATDALSAHAIKPRIYIRL